MTRLAVGDPAPPLALPDPDGAVVRLDPAASAASVVVFTANGCPYARAWHDRIQAVARDYAGRDVAVLQVVSNDDSDHPEDSAEAMAKRVAAGELAGPFLRDADQSAARAYGTTATPEVFVIDRAGVVRDVSVGYDPRRIDGTLWGGEVMEVSLTGFRRLAHLGGIALSEVPVVHGVEVPREAGQAPLRDAAPTGQGSQPPEAAPGRELVPKGLVHDRGKKPGGMLCGHPDGGRPRVQRSG